ncbi:hypothetical protein CHS0354_035325 [Potamilus streckersoni]|uniref:Inosine-5'-monophosphate dehydrogenase n=1 Tax=Potamilus streckersoni TaxID=2493646 RepID=A0AAE0S302_9BIVA|nr:hypothetical protein CHS0354_035325 [Potamilus streckersoni]
MTDRQFAGEGLTFDDVLLLPDYSEFIPADADTSTLLTREIKLNIPLISAAMDTVTEANAAICMAQEGGIGIIHKNMSVRRQADEVEKVKRSESGIISRPVTVSAEQPLSDAVSLMERFRISGFPVLQGKELVGILTNRDIRFVKDFSRPVSELMTKGRDKLITVKPGISLEEAKEIMHRHRIEKLLQVNDAHPKSQKYPLSSKDASGRLRVGAAVGTDKSMEERVDSLYRQDVDVIVLDTAHGHSKNVINSLRFIKKTYPDLQVITGNVATPEATEMLIDNGADAVKVGIGPGSICTTRIISGVGVPQFTAVMLCATAARKKNIPVIADGGLNSRVKLSKRLSPVLTQSCWAAFLPVQTRLPGEIILYQGRRYKTYRGMGSIGAMREGSRDRYFQENTELSKLVPEGIEGRVPYKGTMSETIHQLVGGLKAGMGYTGNATIPLLMEKTRFMKITSASLRESHVHDVMITEESPNYIKENMF